MSVRIDTIVTSGTFSLDGGTWDVDNNVYVIGDDHECIVVDAPHDAAPIVAAVGGRRCVALLLTHAHDDHIRVARDVAAQVGAEIYLHPADRMLWDNVYDEAPDGQLSDGQSFAVGDQEIQVIHTPGHSPGSVCFYVPELSTLLSGDTLFNGGPGATGRSYSSFDTIIDSIRDRVLTLPEGTRVLTGHGDPTSVGDEAPHLEEWIARGH